MRLWLLRPVDDDDPRFSYDCNWGFVISAESEEAARKLAQANGADEVDLDPAGRAKSLPTWLDDTVTSCVELTSDGPEEVIISDFHAG